MNTKKILVPCDFTETAFHAFGFASEIALRNDAEVCVLHAVEFPLAYEATFGAQPYAFDRMALNDMEADARKNFDDMLSRYGDEHVKATLFIDYGSVTQSIRQYIEDQSIDLVVMGTHGATGFREFFVGSNTEKIVRFSTVPVFCIKAETHVANIRNIVLPVLPEPDQDSFVNAVKELQEFFNATLKIVFVNTPINFKRDDDIRESFEDFIRHYGLRSFTFDIYNDANEEEGIMNFVKKTRADMIAMATHARKGLAHFLTGSLTEDVVNHVNCPIWTYALKS